MFRLSQYLHELEEPPPIGPVRQPPGPVVIWNLIRRCNLTCKHCYSISGDVDFPGELSTAEVFRVMDDLKAFRVPVLILSGGEPLMRPDIFEISLRAKAMRFYVGLSSNGTLVDAALADRIRDVSFDYVGISLDGIGETHDRFRGKHGAYEEALNGLRLLRDRGIKVGVRFTMTEDNAAELPRLLDLVEQEGFPKFYLSHLVYAGRGNKNRGDDAAWQTTRNAMDMVIDSRLALGAIGRRYGDRHGQQRCRRGLPVALGGTRRAACRCGTAPEAHALGRQFIGRQCRQHRQSRRRASGYDVVAPQPGQCEDASIFGDLVGSLRSDHGGLETEAARHWRTLRRLRKFRYLQR